MGYAFTASAEPGEPVLVPDGDKHSAQPGTYSGSGFGVELGWEIGPTRLVAAAASVSYSGMFGTDVAHNAFGGAALVLRPGNLRIAAGPTYGLISASGTGVPDWFDVGQDPARYPPSTISYSGTAWVGGARLTTSYGLLDFDPLQGVVELGGHWQTDGARSYFDVGIRVGIVPKVPRFKG